jgi:hypothetical protein
VKNRRKLSLLLGIAVGLLSACAPVAKTTEEKIETPTVATPISISAQTQKPTATQQLTGTPTPEPTATTTVEPTLTMITNTGIAKPDQSFAEFVPEDSPLRGAFFELMRTQFADGGLEKSSGNTYSLACIASEDIHYHQNNIELPDGYTVTHSIPCQYYDAQGEEQIVYIPAMIFNLDKDLYQYLGRGPVSPVSFPDLDPDSVMNMYSQFTGVISDIGPINLYKKHDGYIGKGHPITLIFSSDLEENFSMPQDLLSNLITSEDFTNFAQDGNPAHLPEQLLWTRETGLKNNNFPKEPLD